MKAEKKFSVRDNVWVMSHNKAIQGRIDYIEIRFGFDYSISIRYYLEFGDVGGYREQDIFATKDELLNHYKL